MRASWLAVLVVLAAPVAARADAPRRDDGAQTGSGRITLSTLRPALPLLRDSAAAALVTEQQRIALVLGIVPGFGLGHVAARSSRWPAWLAVDLALAAVWGGGAALGAPDRFHAVLAGTTILERLFEGIDAYDAATGRFGAAQGEGSALAAARPVSDPAAGPFIAVR